MEDSPDAGARRRSKLPVLAIAIGVVGLAATGWYVLLRPEPAQEVLSAADSVTITIDEVEDASNLIAQPSYTQLLERTVQDHGTFRIDISNGTLVSYAYGIDTTGVASEDAKRPGLRETFTWAFVVDDSMPLEDHALRIWTQAAPLLEMVNGEGNSEVGFRTMSGDDPEDRAFLEQFGRPSPGFISIPFPSENIGDPFGGGERDRYGDADVFEQRRHSLSLTVMHSDGVDRDGDPVGDPRYTQLDDGKGIVFLEARLRHRSLAYGPRDVYADTPLTAELREVFAPLSDSDTRLLSSDVKLVPHWLDQRNPSTRFGEPVEFAVNWANREDWAMPNSTSLEVAFDNVFGVGEDDGSGAAAGQVPESCSAVFAAVDTTLGNFTDIHGGDVTEERTDNYVTWIASGDGYTLFARIENFDDCMSEEFGTRFRSPEDGGRTVVVKFNTGPRLRSGPAAGDA